MDWPAVIECSQALLDTPERIRAVAIGLNYTYRPDSQAFREAALTGGSEAIEAAYIQGIGQYLFVSLDHMLALERSFRPLPQTLTLAPWTCTRVILESCSKSIWLLDSEISAKERAARSLNFKLSDQLELLKYIRADRPDQSKKSQATELATARAEARIAELRSQAEKMNIVEKTNRNERFIGFGSGMPSTLDLIRFGLGQDMVSKYRLLSAAMHGSRWATLTVGARTGRSLAGPIAVPQLLPTYAMSLVITSIQSFALSAFNHFKLYGWELGVLHTILEDGYDQANLNQDARFWR